MKINRSSFNFFILTSLFYVSLIRSTNIGFGYPTAEHLLGKITYLPQKMMLEYMAVFLFLFIVLSYKQINRMISPSIVSISILIICFISFSFSPYKILSLRYLMFFLVSTVSVYLYYVYYGPETLIKSLIKFIKVMFVVNFIYVIIFPQYGIMSANHDGAWRGMFVHKNGCGPFYALTSVIFFSQWWFSKYKTDIYSLFYFLLAVLMVMMSKSATAIVALVIVLLSFFFFLAVTSRTKKSEKIFLLIFYIFMIITFSLTFEIFIDEIFELLGKDPTLTGRTNLWDVLFKLSYQRPLFGYGLGLFSRPEIMHMYSTAFGWAAKSSHSSYVDIILGLGYVGSFFVLFWLLKHIFNSVLKIAYSMEYQRMIAVALSIIFGVLVVGSASSGVLLTGSITWLLIVSMVLFLKSKELVK